MVRFLKFLPLLLLTGCGPSVPRTYRPIDPKTGEEIVNSFTIASDYMMYFGIAAVLIGIVMIIFLKMVKTGGSVIIAGIACFIFAQILNYIGAHLGKFILAAAVITGLACFLYYKAVTTCVPWLEKLLNVDINRDGHIGSGRHSEPIPQDEMPSKNNETLEDLKDG